MDFPNALCTPHIYAQNIERRKRAQNRIMHVHSHHHRLSRVYALSANWNEVIELNGMPLISQHTVVSQAIEISVWIKDAFPFDFMISSVSRWNWFVHWMHILAFLISSMFDFHFFMQKKNSNIYYVIDCCPYM